MATVASRAVTQDGMSRPSLADRPRMPSSPKTPLASRSISGAYGSPGSYSREQEDTLIYELDQRMFSVGYAGESRPRCIWRYGYTLNERSRVGDYSRLSDVSRGRVRGTAAKDYVLYEADLRSVDLTLFRYRLERIVRTIHTDHLQLDQKPKKAALLVLPLTPTKILELTLSILFNHHAQPPSITILTRPSMTCVGAGVRTGLVVDIGWGETVVTAVAEYKTVFERRSIRGGKMLAEALTTVLQSEAAKLDAKPEVEFTLVDEVKDRLAWARPSTVTEATADSHVKVPLTDDTTLDVAHGAIADAVEQVFFSLNSQPELSTTADDNDASLPTMAHDVLRRIPADLRSACAQRIVVDGSQSRIPGLRSKLIRQIQTLIKTHGWDMVEYSGSAKAPKTHHNAFDGPQEVAQSPGANGNVPSRFLPAHLKRHDDYKDMVTQKAERELNRQRAVPFSGKVRGVETLGAWAGASMVLALKIKGSCEIEREDFLKHGLRDSVSLMI